MRAAAALAALLLPAAPAAAADITGNLAVLALPAEELALREIRVQDLGVLHLPTGRIVACDPLVQPNTPPLPRTVPPGDYRVRAWRAPNVHDRVGLAELVLSDAAPVRWELATWPDSPPLGPDEYVGIPVDAGVAGLLDAATVPLVGAATGGAPGSEEDMFLNTVLDPPAPFDDRAMMVTPAAGKPNNVAIVSGWGDGLFPVFWGFAADGSPSRLVIDLMVFENADARDHRALAYDAAVAALGPDARKAADEAAAAIAAGDHDALERLLADRRVVPGTPINPAASGTASQTMILLAVAKDDPVAVELLTKHGQTQTLPPWERFSDDMTLFDRIALDGREVAWGTWLALRFVPR